MSVPTCNLGHNNFIPKWLQKKIEKKDTYIKQNVISFSAILMTSCHYIQILKYPTKSHVCFYFSGFPLNLIATGCELGRSMKFNITTWLKMIEI